MKGPGCMALLAGEVIHMVKCVPVEVKLARTTECYEQFPGIRENIFSDPTNTCINMSRNSDYLLLHLPCIF